MLSKRFLISLLLILGSVSAFAADLAWETDFSQAKAQAKTEGKYILINFTGSDWCPWCFKLRDEVFKTEAFKSYSQKSLVLMEADFPKKKAQPAALKTQNRKLAGDYGIQGFPTVVLLDASGKMIASTGYKRGGAVIYVEHLKSLIQKHEVKDQK